MWPDPQPNAISMNVYSHGSSHMIKKKTRINQCLRAFGVPWSPSSVVLGLPPRDGFRKQSKWPWNMIHSMQCKNPSRHYTHLAFTYSFDPSSISVNLNLDRLRLFHQWECSKWPGHGLSVSCAKWPFVVSSPLPLKLNDMLYMQW